MRNTIKLSPQSLLCKLIHCYQEIIILIILNAVMFREGQYLEVIKVSENCLATAIITVKEKSVEIDKKKINTNKWLNLEDWSSLYKIIQRAILRNREVNYGGGGRSLERRKSTRRMDVTYSYEPPKDSSSLPTIRVRVSPAKKRHSIEKPQKSENERTENISSTFEDQSTPEMKVKCLMEGIDEEYVPPDIPNRSKAQKDLEYVPSRKSVLKQLKKSRETGSDEYTPTSDQKIENETSYIPNPISSLRKKSKHELYEPSGTSALSSDVAEAYIPSSKGSSTFIEEYEPDYPPTTVQLDVTYVPSSKKRKIEEIITDKIVNKRRESELKETRKVSSKKKNLATGKRER